MSYIVYSIECLDCFTFFTAENNAALCSFIHLELFG